MNNSPEKKKLFSRLCIITLTFVVSFLYGFPHLLRLNDLNWNYENAIFITSFSFLVTDTHHYLTQIKEIYEGNYLLSNAYLAEYKNMEKSLWPQLPFFLVAFLGKFLHLKVQYLAVLMNFTLPPLAFLLAYWFLYTISTARGTSILGAFILTLTPHISRLDVLFSTGIQIMLLQSPVLGDAHCYHCFSRPINPQLTYLFLLAALLFFFKSIRTSKIRHVILSVFWGIITSYSYVYFSTYFYTFLGICVIGFFVLKEWGYLRQSLAVLGITLMFSIPFWYSVFSYSSSSLNQMAWMAKDHTPIIDIQLLFTLLVCLCISGGLIKRAVSRLTGLASLALLLSGVICMNQHVITGIRVQPRWHYHTFIIPQSLILAVALLTAEFIKTRRIQRISLFRWIKQFSTASLFLFGGIGLGSVSVFLHPSFVATYLSSDGRLTPRFTSLLEILHLSGFCLGFELLILGLLLKTHLHTFMSKLACVIRELFLKTVQFLHRRLHIGSFLYALVIVGLVWDIGMVQYDRYQNNTKPDLGDLQDLAPALRWLDEYAEKESVILVDIEYVSTDIITIYTDNNVYISSHARYYSIPPLSELQDRLYNLMYFMGVTSREDFDQFISRRNVFVRDSLGLSFEEYQEKLEKDLYSELTKYRVDYLFYGPREQKSFRVDPDKTYPFLKKVYDDGIVKIYRII